MLLSPPALSLQFRCWINMLPGISFLPWGPWRKDEHGQPCCRGRAAWRLRVQVLKPDRAGFESQPHDSGQLCDSGLVTSPLCATVPLHNKDRNPYPKEVDMNQKGFGAKEWLQGRGGVPHRGDRQPLEQDCLVQILALICYTSDLRESCLHPYASVSSFTKRVIIGPNT